MTRFGFNRSFLKFGFLVRFHWILYENISFFNKFLANVVGSTFGYYLFGKTESITKLVGDGQSLQWMTYLQPISPQEFLLKIPVQTITVSSDKIGFLDCENMVVCDSWLTDGICWFLTAGQKIFKSPGQKKTCEINLMNFVLKCLF